MSERIPDRRKNPRVETRLGARIHAADGVVEAVVKNMSLSGLLLETDRPIREMTMLGMRLRLPAAPERRSPAYAFDLTGAVVRCERSRENEDRWELAVFLTEMPRETRAALKAFVEERLSGTRSR